MKNILLLSQLFICLVSTNTWALNLLANDSQSQKKWEKIIFSKIPTTQYIHKDDKLYIEVNSSNSPYIYAIKNKLKVKGIEIKLKIEGSLNLKDKDQLSEDGDDFTFKVGLILPGKRKLSYFEKVVAPKWVIDLEKLAGDYGVEKITFYNLVQQKKLLGQKRTHPLSDLIEEKMQWYHEGNESLDLKVTFENHVETIGIWISPDGDQTQSQYKVIVEKLNLITN